MRHLKLNHLVITSLALFAGVLTYYYARSEFSATRQHNPEIFLIAIPKSGSKYLETAIEINLDYKPAPVTYAQGVSSPEENLHFKSNNIIIKGHYSPPIGIMFDNARFSYQILDPHIIYTNGNKLVLHLRDPRQVLLSMIHHIRRSVIHKNGYLLFNVHPEFLDLANEQQIDWAIDNLLPKIVNWMQDWLHYKELEDERNGGIKILITTYDELIANEKDLYQKILNFFEVKYNVNNYTPPTKDINVNYRKGDPTEWQEVFTVKQKQKIATMIPNSLLQRFGWDRNT